MNAYLDSVATYLNKLSLREKLLVLAVFIAVTYSAWDILFFTAYNKQQQQTAAELKETNRKQTELTIAIARIQAQLVNEKDPNEKIKQAINETQHALEKSHQELEEKLDKLVSPTKITELLRSILLQSQGLKLVSLQNEPVHAIVLNQDGKQHDDTAQTQLYEHATTIKLSGNYLQLHHYLEALEKSPWGLFWDRLEYSVQDYPNAAITLRVHTVSTDAHWIGL